MTRFCSRWKEKTDNNNKTGAHCTMRGSYQTCSMQRKFVRALCPFLRLLNFYPKSEPGAILKRGPGVAFSGGAGDQGAVATIYKWEEDLSGLAHLTQHRLLAGFPRVSTSLTEEEAHWETHAETQCSCWKACLKDSMRHAEKLSMSLSQVRTDYWQKINNWTETYSWDSMSFLISTRKRKLYQM